MSQFKLFPAGAPELVRSNQKDRFYAEHIHSLLSDVTRQVLPLRWWITCQRELQLAAEVAYYGLTTILGNQTLGEEYCNTVQVGSPDHVTGNYAVPGNVRRTVAIALQTVGPYVVEKGFEVLYQRIRDRELGSWVRSEREYELIENFAGYVEEFLTLFSRLHLALFYIRGLFYHLGKRVVGIRYLMIRYGLAKGQTSPQLNTYRILGWLIFLQVAVKVYLWVSEYFKKRWKSRRGRTSGRRSSIKPPGLKVVLESSVVPESETKSNLKCPLCLEACRVQTSTLCGHIFCWSCIAEWSSDKSECPICRATTRPQQLVCLQYFRQ